MSPTEELLEFLMPWPSDKGSRLAAEWPRTKDLLNAALAKARQEAFKKAAHEVASMSTGSGKVDRDLAVRRISALADQPPPVDPGGSAG